MNDDLPVETKAFVENVITRLKSFFASDRLKYVVNLIVRRNYNKGLTDVEESLRAEVNVVPNQEAIDFISNYTFDNIKGMNESIGNDLRGELTRAFMNNETNAQIKARVEKVMSVGKTRAAAIARTESHRAYNAGAYHAARQSGLNLVKEWYNPSPQSDICKHLAGTEKPLSEKFVYKGDSWMLPPAHVNCRSRILYKQVGGSS